eukprot:TRINITY_DN23640_c0_g1_i1.p1 TRINITY_DN23640_c0_g1~~TRINITY_DN23640_c0_g1_i1.p1  ORF type:complete len:120 (-),score=38.54 TRINITY_DN23640_c0_g1_i1:10-369(-)
MSASRLVDSLVKFTGDTDCIMHLRRLSALYVSILHLNLKMYSLKQASEKAPSNSGSFESCFWNNSLAELPRRALPASSNAVNPVSYTHLRAHETVLDLVCRLLLEKKKNKKKNHKLSRA